MLRRPLRGDRRRHPTIPAQERPRAKETEMPELPVNRRSPDLDRIWVGMPVIDSDGRTIGAVRNVCLDGTAEPSAAKQTVADDLAGDFARALAEGPSGVPASRAEDLARRGFLKVSGLGPFDHDL